MGGRFNGRLKGGRGQDWPPHNGRRGVTLIEMMVVVAIVGLIVSVSIPSVASGIDSVRLASATDSVAAFLNAAVNRAERRQQVQELVISIKDNMLALYTDQPGPAKELRMPDGIALEGVIPKIEDSGDGTRRFILMPGGVVPGIGIQIGNRHGAHRIVRLDPMTGFPRVESVNTE